MGSNRRKERQPLAFESSCLHEAKKKQKAVIIKRQRSMAMRLKGKRSMANERAGIHLYMLLLLLLLGKF